MWEGHQFSKVTSLGLQITSWRSSTDEPVSLRIDTFAITDFYSLIPPYYTDIHFVKFTILVRWICIYLLFGVWYFINSGRLLLGLTWLEKKKKLMSISHELILVKIEITGFTKIQGGCTMYDKRYQYFPTSVADCLYNLEQCFKLWTTHQLGIYSYNYLNLSLLEKSPVNIYTSIYTFVWKF